MAARKRGGGLTADEKRIVKALLNEGWRNQDIQALVNEGRQATINSARITGVKQDAAVVPAEKTAACTGQMQVAKIAKPTRSTQ
jgi:hypothetical protein